MSYSMIKPIALLTGLVAIALPGVALAASSVTGAKTMAQIALPDTAATQHHGAVIPVLSEAMVPPFPGADISPSHWAYTAVDNLFTTYGCVEGYPDGSFRGDQAVSRNEFAAALNSCLNALVEGTEQGQGATLDEILADLNRLQAELGDLDSQVDRLQE